MASAAKHNNVKVNIINDHQASINLQTVKIKQYFKDYDLSAGCSSLTQSVVNEPELVLSLDKEGSLVPDVREE